MADNWFLRCQVHKGMFSDEVAVEVSQLSGQPSSFFVPKAEVVGGINQKGQVRVRVFRQNNTAWAVLPTENPMEIPVKEADLIAP